MRVINYNVGTPMLTHICPNCRNEVFNNGTDKCPNCGVELEFPQGEELTNLILGR